MKDCQIVQNLTISATITPHIREIGTRMSLAQRRRGAEVKVMLENTIGTKLIEAAIEVHRELGPGLLESVYVTKRRLPMS
jgi:hypothetical protein